MNFMLSFFALHVRWHQSWLLPCHIKGSDAGPCYWGKSDAAGEKKRNNHLGKTMSVGILRARSWAKLSRENPEQHCNSVWEMIPFGKALIIGVGAAGSAELLVDCLLVVCLLLCFYCWSRPRKHASFGLWMPRCSKWGHWAVSVPSSIRAKQTLSLLRVVSVMLRMWTLSCFRCSFEQS